MKRLATLFIFSLFFLPQTNAQFLKKLKKRAVDAVERTVSKRTEKEVQKSTDRALDTVIDSPKQSQKKQKTKDKVNKSTAPESAVGGSNSWQDQYHFPVSATFVFEDCSGKGEKSNITQQYGKHTFATKMDDTNGVILIDIPNNIAILLDTKELNAQAVSLAFMEKMAAPGMAKIEDNNQPTIKKTGKTKIILGYTSEEFEITSDDHRMLVWLAKDVDFEYQDFVKGFEKLFNNAVQPLKDFLYEEPGFMMEMHTFKADGKKLHAMQATKISKNPISYNMNTYKIQKL